MSIFKRIFKKRKPKFEFGDPSIARYSAMMRLIIDLKPQQYEKLKEAMDKAYESFRDIRSIKTDSEKIDNADYLLSKEGV